MRSLGLTEVSVSLTVVQFELSGVGACVVADIPLASAAPIQSGAVFKTINPCNQTINMT